MYAIIESGGKQLRVEEGRVVKVSKLAAEPGSELTIDKVLVVGTGREIAVGAPYVDSARVTCQVVDHGREKKIKVFHKWRRNDSRKARGHRQDFTTLKVTSITA